MREEFGMRLDTDELLRDFTTIDNYDIKRKSETWADGVPVITWSVFETRDIDVRPIKWEEAEHAEITIGGETYIPAFRGFISVDSDVSASHRITKNSGTTDLLVLRVYEYEDHKEIDLQEVNK